MARNLNVSLASWAIPLLRLLKFTLLKQVKVAKKLKLLALRTKLCVVPCVTAQSIHCISISLRFTAQSYLALVQMNKRVARLMVSFVTWCSVSVQDSKKIWEKALKVSNRPNLIRKSSEAFWVHLMKLSAGLKLKEKTLAKMTDWQKKLSWLTRLFLRSPHPWMI